jgi:hypothetical protein
MICLTCARTVGHGRPGHRTQGWLDRRAAGTRSGL